MADNKNTLIDKNLESLLESVVNGLDDEMIQWCAENSGNPIPTPTQCNGLRNQARDKVTAAEKQGLKNYHIATDGKSIYIFKTSGESLALVFSKHKKNESDLPAQAAPRPQVEAVQTTAPGPGQDDRTGMSVGGVRLRDDRGDGEAVRGKRLQRNETQIQRFKKKVQGSIWRKLRSAGMATGMARRRIVGGMIGRNGFFYLYEGDVRRNRKKLATLDLTPIQQIKYEPTSALDYMRKHPHWPTDWLGPEFIQFCNKGIHLLLRGEKCKLCFPEKFKDEFLERRRSLLPRWLWRLLYRRRIREAKAKVKDAWLRNWAARHREKMLWELRDAIAFARWMAGFPPVFWMKGNRPYVVPDEHGIGYQYIGPSFTPYDFDSKSFHRSATWTSQSPLRGRSK